LNPERRGPAATGLLVLAILVSLAASPAQTAGRLAAVGVGAVLFRGLFALHPVRRALQPFAEPLDLLVGTTLVLTVVALTGGIRSPFALLLFVDLLLVRAALGPAAARFLTLLMLLGLGVLAGTAGWPASSDEMVALAARVLWPLPVLLAMEVGLPAAPAPPPADVERPARAESAPPARPRASTWEPETPPAARPEPAVVRRAPPPRPPRAGAGPAEAWGAVAHDLRSPLSVIRVYADLIAEQAARGEPPRADHLRNLDDEIALMEGLLAAPGPRPAAAPPEPAAAAGRVELVRLLGALTESYRLAHSDRLRVEFVAERAEVPVAAEVVSLQRVFRNLLDNAVKFTPPGGRVRVRVGADAGYAVVTVSDTGVGMTADERSRAFEYSFRGRAARGIEGRGIGLGVSRELVEKSGGTIALASEQGQGSDVTVRLPLAEGFGRSSGGA
jgi:signal transduction histidine kinase